MIVRSLAALLIVFAVGCASEKALNRGCASSVRVSAVVFDKAVYNCRLRVGEGFESRLRQFREGFGGRVRQGGLQCRISGGAD